MRVDVVVSPFYLADELSQLLPTLAAGCIRADLKRYGHDVRVHDLRPLLTTRNRWREYLNSCRSWVMEAPHMRVMDRLRYKFQAGASPETLLNLGEHDCATIVDLSMDLCTSPIDNIETFKAVHKLIGKSVKRLIGGDVVALTSAIFTNLYSNLLLGFLIKRYRPELPVIIGGPSVFQSERLARYLVKTGAFDAVAMGDAETILQPYLGALAEGRDPSQVPGIITHRRSDAPYQSPPPTDIRTLPTPDFTGLDLDNYLPLSLPIHTTRGCVFRCRYCSEHQNRFIHMPVEQVVRDIRTLQARHRARLFFFCDSLLNGDRDWFYELCDEMATMDIRWVAYLRVGGKQSLTGEQIRRIVAAGCYLIRLGVDSLEPVILKKMARPQNPTGIIREIESLRDRGVHVDANIITGFPGETRHMVMSTILRLRALTQESDRLFAEIGSSFFQRLIASDYSEAAISCFASVLVNFFPFHVRPGSRTYTSPEMDGLTFQYFDPDRFGYPVEAEIADLIRQIPDSFSGDVSAPEILQRVRLINRSLRQPIGTISRTREMAIILWVYSHGLEPDDVVGPLENVQILKDTDGGRLLFMPALQQHLPIKGGLATVIDYLTDHTTAIVSQLLTRGEPQAVRNALALLIFAGLLPRPTLARRPDAAGS